MMNLLKTVLILIVISHQIFGSEVLKSDDQDNTLWISSGPRDSIKVKDRLCVYKAMGMVGCGEVIVQTRDRFALRMYDKRAKALKGEVVSLRKTKRTIATTEQLASKFEDGSKRSIVDLALGFNAGLNYYYPSLHFQIALNRNFSLGISPAYAKYSQSDDSVTLFGGYITATYYYTHFAFKGVNFEGGLGYFNVKASSSLASEEMSPMAAKLTAGWRGRALIGLPIDFGGALGAQYIFSNNSPLDTTFKGFLPLLNVFVAYCF